MTTTESQAAAESRAAKLQAAAVERAAAELRATTETTTDADAQAALKTVKRPPAQLSRDIHRSRADLVESLNALEDKLNVPKRWGRMRVDARRRFDTMREENPLALAGIGAAAAAGFGTLLWLGLHIARR